MKTNLFRIALVAGSTALATGALAQMPTTPAPAVPAALDARQGTTTDLATPLQPTQVVYAPRLPTAQELADVAKARGFTVARIEQSATEVTVAYNLPDGQTNVVRYVLLSSAATNANTVVVKPAPTVIYAPSPRVYYYDPFYYDPWYYPPVALSFGFGFGHYRGGWGGGGYRGGGHHGGWHR